MCKRTREAVSRGGAAPDSSEREPSAVHMRPLLLLLVQALLFTVHPCTVGAKGSYSSYRTGRRNVSPGWYRSRTYGNYESNGLRNTQLFRWLWCWAVDDDDCKSAEPFLVSVVEGCVPLATGQTTVRLTLYNGSTAGLMDIASAKTSAAHSVFLNLQMPRWEQHLAVGWPDITAATQLNGDNVMVHVLVEQAGGWLGWLGWPENLAAGCITLNTLRTSPNKYTVLLYENETETGPSRVCDGSRRQSARADLDLPIACSSRPWVTLELNGFREQADSDDDGALDKHEIRDWVGESEDGVPFSQGVLQAAQHRVREHLDLNQDGTMSAEEAARLVSEDYSVLDEVLDEEGGAASIGHDIFDDRGFGDDSFLTDDGFLVSDSEPVGSQRRIVDNNVLAVSLAVGVLCVVAFVRGGSSWRSASRCYEMRPWPSSAHSAATAGERYHSSLTATAVSLPMLRGQPPNVRSVVNGDATSISNAVAPAGRENIHVLRLPSNDIRSLVGLQDFTRLLQLDVSSNDLRSLDGIGCAPALTMLDVSNNDLSGENACTPLMQCVALEWLDVANNDLTSLGAGLPSSLQYLNASSNDLTNVTAILELRRLECLDLSNNCLRDLSPEDFVGRLPDLKTIAFGQNDLQGPSTAEAVTTMMRGGVREALRHHTWPTTSTTLRSINTSNQRLVWIGLHGNSFSPQEIEAMKRAMLRFDRPDLAESAFVDA